MPPKKKVERAATENISLGPQVREGQYNHRRTPIPPRKFPPCVGDIARSDSKTIPQTGELVFGVARIFASFNDTFVHVTDLRFVQRHHQMDLKRNRRREVKYLRVGLTFWVIPVAVKPLPVLPGE